MIFLVGSEVIMTVTIKGAVFSVVTPRSSETGRSFGPKYRLRLQGRRVTQSKNRS
jgi:hypothetical protein